MTRHRTDRSLLKTPATSRQRLQVAAKLLLIAAFIAITNVGFGARLSLLLGNSRYDTLVPYLGVWAIAMLAVVVAAFQPNPWVRLFWTLVIALSSAVAWGYYHASQSEVTVFDIVSLWNARHEAGRAADFYRPHIALTSIVLASGVLLMIVPVGVNGALRRWLGRLFWFPAVPVVLIAGVVFLKGGGGSQAMPSQFTPVALGSLAGARIALQGAPVRRAVAWQPLARETRRNIVVLVDESIRADYLDFTPGNPHTPRLAALAGRFTDFGPAVSGGNCSNYSNAILRFGASRADVTGSINTNPTLWQYAKTAGYRTVFIDAQAGGITNPGLLQNFMSMTEKADIDRFHAIRDVASDQADMRLAAIVAEELKAGGPVFIYANKNGAHFPYDDAYPADKVRYHPTMTEAGNNSLDSRVASYRNALAWSVDDFMDRLFASAGLANTTLVYTSDHAQNLDPRGITHCQVENPDPRMALVPLLVATDDAELRAGLEASAAERRGTVSHFQIVPSVLEWMGYAAADVAAAYDESLTRGPLRQPAFTSGDVFGLFSSGVHWTPVDTSQDYREPPARKLLPVGGEGA
jgi:lipid A ethanolaminephosphotransferase